MKDAEVYGKTIDRLASVTPDIPNPRRHYAFHAADLLAVDIMRESLREAKLNDFFADQVKEHWVKFLTQGSG